MDRPRFNTAGKNRGVLFAVITLFFVMFSSCASGPDPAADRVIRDYEGLPGVYTFRIPPALVGIVMKGQNDRDVEEFLKGMETIKVILVNAAETKEKDLPGFVRQFNDALHEEAFEDLMVINQSGNKISVLVHEEGEKTDEAMIMITSPEEFLGLSLVGDIDMKTLGKIVYKINREDFNFNHEKEKEN